MRLALGTVHIGLTSRGQLRESIPIKEAESRTQGLKFMEYQSLEEKRKNQETKGKDGKKDINKKVIMRLQKENSVL